MSDHEPLMTQTQAWEELSAFVVRVHDAHRALACLVDRSRGVDSSASIEVPVIDFFVSALNPSMANVFDHLAVLDPAAD